MANNQKNKPWVERDGLLWDFYRLAKYPLTIGEPTPKSQASLSTKTNPHDFKLDKKLLARIWKITKPYWVREGAWVSWATYAFLLLSSFVSTAIFVYSTEIVKDLTNAIIAYNNEAFIVALVLMAVVQIVRVLFGSLIVIVDNIYELHWRKWLTRYLLNRYMHRRTYYDIALKGDIDNPDQRIQAEVQPFTSAVSSFPRTVLYNVLMIFGGSAVVLSIAPGMLWFVIAYLVVHALVTYFIYIPTIKQHYDVTVAEADLRFGITHVREHAETVAFYRGEDSEKTLIDAKLLIAIRRWAIIFYYKIFIGLTNSGFSLLWKIVPYLILVPLFFEHKIDFGSIAQATLAAKSLMTSLDMLTTVIPQIASAAPRTIRLAEIEERFDAMDKMHEGDSIPQINKKFGDYIELDNVCLETPGGEQKLADNLTLKLEQGEHLVVLGRTGVGKSSLLRLMAGLWCRGSGVLTMPPHEQSLFLPQRPYMTLGTLRTQLLYPHGNANDISDEELAKILETVSLPGMLRKHGGLDAVQDWSKILSLGEQQRIGFARILVSKPKFIFLDEATSGIDPTTESQLYGVIEKLGVAYISVGHRKTILQYHDRALELLPGGDWTISSIEDVTLFDGEVS